MEAIGVFKSKSFCKKFSVAILSACLIFSSCQSDKKEELAAPTDTVKKEIEIVPMLTYTLVNQYPHDITAFTEGLLFYKNQLLESTGAPENMPQTYSSIGIVDLEKGKLNKKIEIDKKIYFGEGIVVFNNLMYQLTYTNQVGFVYDANSFQKKSQFSYTNPQGWGLTCNDSALIMSDGTEIITYFNPKDFSPTKKITVTENGFALTYLNELEYVNGFIYANIWMTQFIVKINPETGKVVGKYDMKDLYNLAKSKNINLLEMNGIAYNASSNTFFITGKLWPTIFEVKM
jgi:glutamine cyclotransferase